MPQPNNVGMALAGVGPAVFLLTASILTEEPTELELFEHALR